MQEWMAWEPTKARRFSSLLLTPARVVVGIGAGLAIVAGLMPWAEGTAPSFRGIEPVFFSGLGGSGDGIVLIMVSAATGILTLHRTPAQSRIRSLRAAPAILVLLGGFTWINGYRASVEAIAGWERQGGTGQIAPGLWLAGIGILLQAAGTVWLLPEVIRWRRRADDPADVVHVGVREVAEVLAGLAGVVVGGAAGIALAVAFTGPMLVGALALGATFGGLLGAYGGSWVARRVADVVAERRSGT